ncbi:hypothetical protein MNBD_ALPHA12-583 [hydrothermal vent metagenome]|uniref:Uncharacterized protein n=1 Tax=hydrothermal vent metagenome TaxID=652676 RepID=A0A3B0TEC6_9ZZZZ
MRTLKSVRILKPLFWIVLCLTLVNYLAMLLWSGPTLGSITGGLAIFDLRVTGYDLGEAKALLSALGNDGISFYLNVQQKLDLSFPALLALTIMLAIILLAPARFGRWRYLLALVAIVGMVFDYMENAAVRLLLLAGPDNINQQIVAMASARSINKWTFTVIAIAIVVVFLLFSVGEKFRAQKSDHKK